MNNNMMDCILMELSRASDGPWYSLFTSEFKIVAEELFSMQPILHL